MCNSLLDVGMQTSKRREKWNANGKQTQTKALESNTSPNVSSNTILDHQSPQKLNRPDNLYQTLQQIHYIEAF